VLARAYCPKIGSSVADEEFICDSIPVVVAALCRWLRRQQDKAIAFLREENRVLKAQLRGRWLTTPSASVDPPIEVLQIRRIPFLMVGSAFWCRVLAGYVAFGRFCCRIVLEFKLPGALRSSR